MPPSLEHLDVMEIVRPLASGMTEPFQCRLEDEQLYAVKGRGALARGLLAEVYAAELGRALGLPIPSYTLASMSPALLDTYGAGAARLSIGSGSCFASHWQEPVENLTVPALSKFDRTILAKVFAFDFWVGNGDRTLSQHGGNANLLVRLSDESLVVIDHNLAFSENFQVGELTYHACRGPWYDLSRQHRFIADLTDQMVHASASIRDLEGSLPDEWLDVEPCFPSAACEMVDRVTRNDFWEAVI